MLPLELLQILACPICKGELTQGEDGSSLHCTPCDRDYPVIDGIPGLLKEQSGAIQTKRDNTRTPEIPSID